MSRRPTALRTHPASPAAIHPATECATALPSCHNASQTHWTFAKEVRLLGTRLVQLIQAHAGRLTQDSQRFHEGVPVSQLVYALLLIERQLRHYKRA